MLEVEPQYLLGDRNAAAQLACLQVCDVFLTPSPVFAGTGRLRMCEYRRVYQRSIGIESTFTLEPRSPVRLDFDGLKERKFLNSGHLFF